jgi:hypothetical protein
MGELIMKDTADLLDLKATSPATNLWRALVASVTKARPAYTMNGLVSENWWAWAKSNIASLWKAPYAPYPYYSYPPANNGIFKIAKTDPVNIALLSDWASDTPQSQLIAAQAGIQDYSIHLGDTYYVGSSNEITENFDETQGGTWPYGIYGSFALMGNHEMYSGGTSYFTELLPYMGLYTPGQELPVQVQQAGFFCLENAYWRIIGLDTGYDSLTGMFESANTNLQLRPELQDWLTNTVRINDDKRGIILLSHHQCWSAFEQEFPNPAAFISGLIGPARDILWLWGHEHRFSVYGPLQLPSGSNVFARCIGNSGMPVELDDKDLNPMKPKSEFPANVSDRNLVLYDQRLASTVDGDVPIGHNGYVMLNLNDAQATLTYYDDNGGSGAGRLILEEKWSVDTNSGKLSGLDITDYTAISGLPPEQILTLFSDRWSDAITVKNPPLKAPIINS